MLSTNVAPINLTNRENVKDEVVATLCHPGDSWEDGQSVMLTLEIRGGSGQASSGAGIGESPERCYELVWTRQPEDWSARQLKAWEAARHLELSTSTDELEQRKPWLTYAGWDWDAPHTGKTVPQDPQRCSPRSI